MFLVSSVLLLAAGAALCIAYGEDLTTSIRHAFGGYLDELRSLPRLGETMDKNTAATVVTAADIFMEFLPTGKRLIFAATLRGIFAFPVFWA